MTDLRTAAQQAKIDEIAVEQWKLRMVFYDENGEPSMSRQPEPDEIRAALTQQAEPVEPVAWRYKYSDGFWRFSNGKRVNGCDPIESQALYTAPPQRKPLTEEEIEACRQQGYAHGGLSAPFDFGKAARAVERAHGIGEKK